MADEQNGLSVLQYDCTVAVFVFMLSFHHEMNTGSWPLQDVCSEFTDDISELTVGHTFTGRMNGILVDIINIYIYITLICEGCLRCYEIMFVFISADSPCQ
jgi:hypothetical protein